MQYKYFKFISAGAAMTLIFLIGADVSVYGQRNGRVNLRERGERRGGDKDRNVRKERGNNRKSDRNRGEKRAANKESARQKSDRRDARRAESRSNDRGRDRDRQLNRQRRSNTDVERRSAQPVFAQYDRRQVREQQRRAARQRSDRDDRRTDRRRRDNNVRVRQQERRNNDDRRVSNERDNRWRDQRNSDARRRWDNDRRGRDDDNDRRRSRNRQRNRQDRYYPAYPAGRGWIQPAYYSNGRSDKDYWKERRKAQKRYRKEQNKAERRYWKYVRAQQRDRERYLDRMYRRQDHYTPRYAAYGYPAPRYSYYGSPRSNRDRYYGANSYDPYSFDDRYYYDDDDFYGDGDGLNWQGLLLQTVLSSFLGDGSGLGGLTNIISPAGGFYSEPVYYAEPGYGSSYYADPYRSYAYRPASYNGGNVYDLPVLDRVYAQGYNEGYIAGERSRTYGSAYSDPYTYGNGAYYPYSTSISENRRCLSDGYQRGYQDALYENNPAYGGNTDLVSVLLSNALSFS